jgi:hypothetical protein
LPLRGTGSAAGGIVASVDREIASGGVVDAEALGVFVELSSGDPPIANTATHKIDMILFSSALCSL